ncbi:hypothetical protein H0H93_001371 [Arthromyces matolae]|nr:hypothetical protein H0H93_001371 [Arthromyces matolae]
MWTYLRLADGGTIGLDFAPLDDPTLPDDTPIIVVQHGLTGGSYEPYVRAILHRASEEGSRSRIISGCALACPWDLERNNKGYVSPRSRSTLKLMQTSCDRLLSSFLGKHVYLKAMGGNFQSLLRRHEKELQADLEHIATRVVPSTLALLNPTLEQVDDIFTRVAGGPAPTFPFSTVDEYYRWGSSHNVVQKIGVPFLAINADDDPIVSHVPMDDGGNGLIVMGLTRSGGHLGWFQAGLDGSGSFVDRWSTKPVLEWLKLTGEDIVHSTATPSRRLYVDEEGWLREEGTYMLGCKMIAEGGVFNGNGGEQGMLQGL